MDIKNNFKILEDNASTKSFSWVEIEYQSIVYDFYFKEGKFIYASHSAMPSERLDRHLKKVSNIDKSIDKKIRYKAHSLFEELTEKFAYLPAEFLVIESLRKKNFINSKIASLLIESLSKEVLESYFLIPSISPETVHVKKHQLNSVDEFDLKSLSKECVKKLQGWQSLSKHIKSFYQRPYLFKIDPKNKHISLAQQKKLSSILKGFNFLQLEAVLNKDKLSIAKKVYPLILHKMVILREPQNPFDKLPFLNDEVSVTEKSEEKTPVIEEKEEEIQEDDGEEITLSGISNSDAATKKYTIVCVDDSPIILKSINNFLSRENLTIVPINNAAKALIMITRVKPDLILMDIGMPNIDGYQLCTLIRKHSIFQDTPIIMVTGNKGIINRAKAKLAGATDYMTKPFTQEDLLTMVFRYLSD